MEQISRMAAEVNKLIGLNLLDGRAVYLAELGTLHTVVNADNSKGVAFSTTEQGAIPLIGIIKERAGCSAEQAANIAKRWIEEVGTPDTINIEGVGTLTLSSSSFALQESFSLQLNKDNSAAKPAIEPTAKPIVEPVKQTEPKAKPTLKPESTKIIEPDMKESQNTEQQKSFKGIIIAAIIIVLGVGVYFGTVAIKKSKAEKAEIEAIALAKAQEQQRIADSIALAQIEAKRQALETPDVEPQGARYKVVYGVYELRSNVDVAIKKINKQYGAGSAHEYPFGRYTLVSMFESNVRSESQNFLMSNYDTYPDAWIYEIKR